MTSAKFFTQHFKRYEVSLSITVPYFFSTKNASPPLVFAPVYFFLSFMYPFAKACLSVQ